MVLPFIPARPRHLLTRILSCFCFALFFASQAFSQTVSITSITDPYTGTKNLAPGGLASIHGPFLGQNPKVTVGGMTAYIVTPPFLSNGASMTIQIPVNAFAGLNNVSIALTNGSTAPFPITLSTWAPVLIAATAGSVLSPAHSSGLPVTSTTPAAPGETVVLSAIGLGPTNPVIATGALPSGNISTTAAPTVTLGSSPITGAVATLSQTQVGIYQVSFTVPVGMPTGSYPVSLSIGGATSNSISLNVAPPQSAPAISAVLDAQTSASALCPGDLATIWGTNLGTNPTVTVGGKTAYIVTAPQNDQMTIEIPVDAAVGPATVTVASGGQTSASLTITLSPSAPVIYGPPLHANTGMQVTSANPALPNETILFSAIGLGATNPVVPTGTPAPANATSVNPPAILLPGTPNIAGAATLVPGQVGVYQISFTLPASPTIGNAVLLRVQAGPSSAQTLSNLLTIAIAQSVSTPSITELENIYSYIQPDMPNYGIAQGSIFAIFGLNLAQGTSAGLQGTPLPLKLQQATVSITVNGTTTQGILYYASPTQIVAVLPSATPVGDGTVTVNNGFAAGSAPIHIVGGSFGILTRNAGGMGPASAFDLNYNALGFTNALNPGDYFILWGTGVGPVSGDETATQTPADLTDVPISMEVGGIPAQVYYHGRSTFPGLDQVIGIVPQGVTPGCWVSVDVSSGNIVSNFATLPIANSGRICSDPTMGLTADAVQSLVSTASFNLGTIELEKIGAPQSTASSNVAIQDAAAAQFLKVNTSDFAGFTLGPSLGSCLVSNTYNGGAPWGTLASSALDVGGIINITGPAGAATPAFQSSVSSYLGQAGEYLEPPGLAPWQGGGGAFNAIVSTAVLPSFIADSGGGTFTFSNGSGGVDVGPFTAAITVDSPLVSFTQGNSLNGVTINRSQGLIVAWSNVGSDSFVLVSGRASTTSTSPNSVEFACAAPASAGQFTIPRTVMLSLPSTVTGPATNPAFTPHLQLAQMTFPKPFSVPGLDFATVQMVVQLNVVAYYQ